MEKELLEAEMVYDAMRGVGQYFGEWKKYEDMINGFDLDGLESKPSPREVYVAWYDVDGYEGSAFVLFEQAGVLYEVNGGHCSCNGLEGQWSPEETNWQALGMRPYFRNRELKQRMKELIVRYGGELRDGQWDAWDSD